MQLAGYLRALKCSGDRQPAGPAAIDTEQHGLSCPVRFPGCRRG
jgi:hypothetical protein